MAQETAASFPIPEGGLVRAWLGAFLHPKFETFRRWYPRMGPRWRRVSLVVSLVLILVTSLVLVADFTAGAMPGAQWLTPGQFGAYLTSGRGLYELFSYNFSSLAVLYAIPASVAQIAYHGIGPYHVRFRVAFGTWMQVQPTVCAFLLFSAVAQLVLRALGIFDSTAFIAEVVTWILVGWSAGASLSYSCKALAAGSGRDNSMAGLGAARVALPIWLFVLLLLPAILGWLGHPLT